MPSRVVTATYRLQLTKDFPFARARELVPYLHDLGVSHLYLSPVLAAKPGSTHGYDVIDHTRINPELGTEDELRALASDLHARDMGIILDVVPNHMSASAYNPYWDNVLERGPASRYASWFDIDWDAPAAKGKVVLPVLGDEIGKVIARGELTVDARDRGMRVKYFDRTFPLDASTLPRELQLAHLDPAAMSAATEWMAGAPGRRRLRALLDAQHYSLRFWRRARTDINYRRFFDVNDLVALRMETDEIFDATHALILRLVHAGVVDGLRVDHVDGLRDPAWYLMKLRAAVNAVRHADGPETVPIVVEKILGGDEQLPATWPVMGTTGYDFMTDVEELFVVPDGFARIEAAYRTLRRDSTLNFREAARDGKRRALRGALWPDVLRLARVPQRWKAAVPQDAIADAIVELIVHLEPYRTYIAEPGVVSDADRAHLDRAFKDAKKTARADPKVLDVLRRAFLGKPSASDTGRAELVARFQQTSGPAAAKGVEDTALYVYLPLASRNEVGASPDRPLADVVTRVHARNALRGRDWPRTLLATNTHDTKRSADVRARIDALTAVPDEWVRDVARWRRLNLRHKRVAHGKPAPDANSEYLYYQSLLGLWPAPSGDRGADDLPSREWMDAARQRLVAYMAKAAREAKTRTSWVDRDEAFEKALDDFVRQSMDPTQSAEFLSDVARLTARVASNGFHFALARVLLHCAAPGIP
ncbi:MAG TPA: malto-oligosyltrehalose synthase, partial [Gemmatimonadaceae bacterium]|nr:malto-oligosyltrehalose synthase [Gemmatimonadaceae bacterium]